MKGKKAPARAGWPTRLRLVRATPHGRFYRYWCSTLFNYNSNLFMRDTFLIKLILLWIIVDYCQHQKNHPIWIWVQLLWKCGHFAPQQRCFTQELYNPGLLPSPRRSLISETFVSNWVHVVFLSFFLGFRRPNLITYWTKRRASTLLAT